MGSRVSYARLQQCCTSEFSSDYMKGRKPRSRYRLGRRRRRAFALHLEIHHREELSVVHTEDRTEGSICRYISERSSAEFSKKAEIFPLRPPLVSSLTLN
jgi:hypothetical protein